MRHRVVKGKEVVFENGARFIVQGDPKENKGKWRSLFENDAPIWLEIGSGKGQFLCTQARLHPEKNFIACEGLEDVYVRIIEKCLEYDLKNLLLIPCFMEHSTDYFEDEELEKVFINFCDPWPKKRHIKRRLTNRDNLNEYKKILGEGKLIQFKTDNDPLFEFSVEEINEVGFEILEITRDLRNSKYEEGNVHTEYEDKFTGFGKTINYVVCKTK